MRKIAIVAIIVIFLAAFGIAVAQKENQLSNGQTVVVALAPVDPFSLMQGHYMALDFGLASQVEALLPKEPARRGTAIITLDESNRASLVRLDDGTPLQAGELRLRYKLQGYHVVFASGAFFFQEGHAGLYEAAEYAELRLDGKGNPLIARLLNNDLEPITSALGN